MNNDYTLAFYYDPEDRYRPSEPEYIDDDEDYEGELADRLYDEWQDEQAIACCQNQN